MLDECKIRRNREDYLNKEGSCGALCKTNDCYVLRVSRSYLKNLYESEKQK